MAIPSTSSPATASVNGAANTVRPDLVAPIRIIGRRPVVRSVSVRGGERFRQSGTKRRHRPGLSQHRPLAHEDERLGVRGSCRSGSTCSICSTTPISARRATSSAARRSARSPDATADRRGRIVSPDPAGREVVILMNRSIAIIFIGWLSIATPAAAQTVPARTVVTIHSGSEFFPRIQSWMRRFATSC